MKKFTYKVKTQQGETLSGEIEATSSNDAAKILLSKKLTPVEIKVLGETEIRLENIPFLSFFTRISKKKKAVIVRQFATLIRSGLTITQSLETLVNERGDKQIQQIFASVLQEVEGGEALSKAFENHPELFSGIDISLVKAGEKSGTLDKVMDRMADQTEKEASLISKVRGALTYPIVILVVAIGVIAVMIVYLVPKLSDLYAGFGKELPFMTKMMVGLSTFITKFWWLTLLIIFVIVSGIVSFIKGPAGRKIFDRLKIHAPIIKGLMIKIYMARFTRTLGTLIGSGVSIVESLKITADAIGNDIYRDEVLKITEGVRQGQSLATSVSESPLFPTVTSQMVKVGEETGEIDAMLNNLANYYEEEVDNIVKSISTILEPVIIVFMGVVVLFILIGVMGPIYQVAQFAFQR